MIDKWLVWINVPAGTVVSDWSEETQAPCEPGLYTLYELVNLDTHAFVGFEWKRQDGQLTDWPNVEDWEREGEDDAD